MLHSPLSPSSPTPNASSLPSGFAAQYQSRIVARMEHLSEHLTEEFPQIPEETVPYLLMALSTLLNSFSSAPPDQVMGLLLGVRRELQAIEDACHGDYQGSGAETQKP